LTQLAVPLERLIGELAKLPGVGRKTAQRFAFHVLKAPAAEVDALIVALRELRERIRPCAVCFNLAESETCAICADPRRERTTVCVVEDAFNVLALERTNVFRGVYHVLGGALSPLKDIGPENLKVAELVERVQREGVKEVILATSPNVEGEATAVYLARLLKPLNVQTTRLAQGLPAGADLEFTDDVTIQRALENRRDY
jgi:recombination protein RecR